MENSINIIPEVRRLRLSNVGPWTEATFEFSPGINIVSGHSGSGRSSILRSLLPFANERLSSRIGCARGSVAVDYARSEFRYELPEIASHDTCDPMSLSVGEKAMLSLSLALQRAKPGCCILMEDDILGSLDAQHRAQAVESINAADCQFIIVLSNRLEPSEFRAPRVFECRADQGSESSSVQMKNL